MQKTAATIQDYINQLPAERQVVINKMRTAIIDNLDSTFEETLSYGMIGYVVPKTVYPAGYHCDTKLPLPFLNLASQKNFIALYHMGLYAEPTLHNWFLAEYPKHCKTKLDMGKSCIRFKKIDDIPYQLISELCGKMTALQWIQVYDKLKSK